MLSEGFWACLGAIIGGGIGATTSYFITKRMVNLELKKLSIQHLNQKRYYLEIAKRNLPLILSEIDIQTDDINNVGRVIYTISQYIPTNEFSDIMEEIVRLDLISDKNRSPSNSHEQLFQQQAHSLYKKSYKIIDDQLIKTLNELEALFK